MPKFLEEKLEKEYGDNPHAIYGTMNAIGAPCAATGETAKGAAMEKKHEADVKKGKKKSESDRKDERVRKAMALY